MVSVLGGKLIKENIPFTGFGGTAFGNLYQVTLEMQNWVSIAQSGIVLSKKDETVPPPLTANQMNNKPIVFLLLVPIISTFMQYLIAGWLQVDANKLWWVAVGLNIICCTMDYYRVKKAGYNADKLMAAFVFLIPLYIYKRMALVKGKKWTLTRRIMFKSTN